MIKNLLILFVLATLSFNNQIFAQNPEWIYLTDGKLVNAICLEGDKLWVGTQTGLKKVDINTGEKIEFFTCNCGISSNAIYDIEVDNDGNKWFATNSGLVKFDNTNWTTYNYSNSSFSYNGDKSNDFFIDIDVDGNIWALYDNHDDGNHLTKFDGTTFHDLIVDSLPMLSGYIGVLSFGVDNTNNVWLALWHKGLLKYDGATWELFDTITSNIPSNDIWSISFDNDNRLWTLSEYESTGEYISYLTSFDGQQWDSTSMSSIMTSLGLAYEDAYIFNPIFDSVGNLMIFILRAESDTQLYYHLAKFDGTNWQCLMSSFVSTDDDEFEPSNSSILAGNGFVVTPTYNGIYLWNDQSIHNITFPSGGLPNNNLLKILIHNNKTYFGTEGYGLFVQEENTWEKIGENELYPYISDIDFDASGNMWISSFEWGNEAGFDQRGKISKFDGSSWSHFDASASLLPLDTNDQVRKVIVDGNTVWVAINDITLTPDSFGGYSWQYQPILAEYDGTNWNEYSLSNGLLPIDSFHINDFLTLDDIICDQNHNLWLSAGQIMKYDGTSWESFNTEMSTFAIDQTNKLYAISLGNIFYFNGNDFEWECALDSTIPCPGTDISADENNALWFGSNQYLYKYKDQIFESFDSKLGWRGWLNSIAIDDRSNKWCATGSGLAIFGQGANGGVSMDIEGNVWNVPENDPVGDGYVYLFNNTNISGGYDTVATTPINADGTYIFSEQANCSFTLFAQPNSNTYPTLLPAYLGDTVIWTQADTLVALISANADTIYCYEKPSNAAGTAGINGNVYSNVNENNDPVKNTGVVLGNDSKGSKSFNYAYTTTDSLGAFAFDNLPLGDYFLIIDYPGIPMDMANNVNRFTLSSSDDSVSVKGYVNPALITLDAPQYIKKTPTAQVSTSVYPNPTSDVLFVEITLVSATDIQFSLTDSRGVVMQKLNNLKLQSGTNNLEINLNNLPSGNYLLSIVDRKAAKILKVEKVVVRR
ncbi:MAG: T9SS type A sorting domain-containing protein [Bacteroidetes bacterium]|nr:T9SS type A sorting domain-containing protein [Bacteroidota bacterium]